MVEDIDKFDCNFLVTHAAEGGDDAGTFFMLGRGWVSFTFLHIFQCDGLTFLTLFRLFFLVN